MIEKMLESCIGIHEGLMQLDISQKYQFIDKDETIWRYSFQKLGDDEGWFTWMTRPGQIEICVGKIPAREIVKNLEANPPLTSDDLIDLELWMAHGGLEIKPKRSRKKKDGSG